MKKSEALAHFDGKVSKLAEALGISPEAIYQWGENVPPLRAFEIRDIIKPQKQKDGEAAA